MPVSVFLRGARMLRAIPRTVEFQSIFSRTFLTSTVSRLRQLSVEKPDENTTIIDCKYIESPRKPYLLRKDSKRECGISKCSLCRLQLNLKHTDVLILSQFMDPKGNIFEFKQTKLCRDQYKLVSELIYMAQHAGLLPEPPRKEPKKPYNLLNTYYDETTIHLRPVKKKHNMRMYYLNQKLPPIEKLRVRPEVGVYYGPHLT